MLAIVNLPDFWKLVNENCKDLHGTNDHQVCLNTADATGTVAIVGLVLFAVGVTIFNIWTIFVAKNAKLEIEGEPFSCTDEHFGLCLLGFCGRVIDKCYIRNIRYWG